MVRRQKRQEHQKKQPQEQQRQQEQQQGQQQQDEEQDQEQQPEQQGRKYGHLRERSTQSLQQILRRHSKMTGSARLQQLQQRQGLRREYPFRRHRQQQQQQRRHLRQSHCLKSEIS